MPAEVPGSEHSKIWRLFGDDDVKGILKLMRAKSGDVKHQRTGFDAVASLAVSTDRKVLNALHTENAASTVVRGMEEHLDVALVQELGCVALEKLARFAMKNVREDVAADGASATAVINAMDAHWNDHHIQIVACNTLRTLVFFDNGDNIRGETLTKALMRARDPYHGQDREEIEKQRELNRRRKIEEVMPEIPQAEVDTAVEETIRQFCRYGSNALKIEMREEMKNHIELVGDVPMQIIEEELGPEPVEEQPAEEEEEEEAEEEEDDLFK